MLIELTSFRDNTELKQGVIFYVFTFNASINKNAEHIL